MALTIMIASVSFVAGVYAGDSRSMAATAIMLGAMALALVSFGAWIS